VLFFIVLANENFYVRERRHRRVSGKKTPVRIPAGVYPALDAGREPQSHSDLRGIRLIEIEEDRKTWQRLFPVFSRLS
jgi:hypothetical protein